VKECCWIKRRIVIWEHCMACYRWKLLFFMEKHEVSVDNLWTSGLTRWFFRCFVDFELLYRVCKL